MREEHRDRFGVLLRNIAEREAAVARRERLKKALLAAALIAVIFVNLLLLYSWGR